MSNFRKVILTILISFTIISWVVLFIMVFTHKEDPKLINYKSLQNENKVQNKDTSKQRIIEEENKNEIED